MNCKTLAKSSAKFLAAALMTVSAFAQNAVPQFPVLKSPTSAVTRNVALNGVVLVRQVLADLMVGDYVDTLEITAKATQAGAALQVFVDQEDLTFGSPLKLQNTARTYSFAINKINGKDYKRISIRSVYGKSQITKIVARVSDPNGDGGDIDPPLPPPPPPTGGPVPPVPPPPVLIPTLPHFNPHANCTTESRGLRFSDSTEADVSLKCQSYQNSFATNPNECYANSNCKNPRMTCTASANNTPVTAYTYDAILQKCSQHPTIVRDPVTQVAGLSTCIANIRCEGGQPGGPVVAPADPHYPWQTKARDSSGELHRFFGHTKNEAIDACVLRVGQVQQCYDAATCQNNCDGGIHIQPPPPPFPGHGGGGHVGILPPPIGNSCRTWSYTSYNGILHFDGFTREDVVQKCINDPKTRNEECRSNVNPDCGNHLVPGPGHGHGHHAVHGLRCTSSDNKLLDAQFNVVYDFNDFASCDEAKSNLEIGKPFCDFSDNTLRRLGGTLIFDFNNANDCRTAIDRVYMGRNFCESESNTLRNPRGEVLFDFSSWTDCVNNLN